MAGYKDFLNGIVGKVKEVTESSNVKDIVNKGADKAKSVARTAKLNLEIGSEKGKLNKVYAELGKLFIEQNEAAPALIYEPFFRQVKEILAGIEGKEAEIRALREQESAAAPEAESFEQVVDATETEGSGKEE